MSEASFASLGPTLLARKGGAKPAMRPQLAPLPGVVPPEAEQLEDLGWNDMGLENDGAMAESGADIVSINPSIQPQSSEAGLIAQDLANTQLGSETPLVRRQQRKLAERILSDSATKAAKRPAKKTQRAANRNPKSARRAAFTLRLDSDRHLKLRLAATMQGVSAQVLVTEALDAMLARIEDLDALASRMKRN